MNKPIFLYLAGSTTPEDITALREGGYIPIQCEGFQRCKIIESSPPLLSESVLVKAAADALSGAGSGSEREKFTSSLLASLKKQIESK